MEKMKFTHQTRLKRGEPQLVHHVKLRAIYSVTWRGDSTWSLSWNGLTPDRMIEFHTILSFEDIRFILILAINYSGQSWYPTPNTSKSGDSPFIIILSFYLQIPPWSTVISHCIYCHLKLLPFIDINKIPCPHFVFYYQYGCKKYQKYTYNSLINVYKFMPYKIMSNFR